MTFVLQDSYVREEDFTNIFNDEYKEENSSYYTKTQWVKAALYCNALSIKEGLEECYENIDKDSNPHDVITHYENNGYRLPTTEECRIDYAKDNFNEKFLADAEWCDNTAMDSKEYRGCVKLGKNSSWEDRNIQTDFINPEEKHPFRIGRNFDEAELLFKDNMDKNLGKPILIKDNMGIFLLFNNDYALCYKGLGMLKNYGKKIPEVVYDSLINEGFMKV